VDRERFFGEISQPAKDQCYALGRMTSSDNPVDKRGVSCKWLWKNPAEKQKAVGHDPDGLHSQKTEVGAN